MTIFSFRYRFLMVLFAITLAVNACGPSAREREQQQKEDSIQLDQERRQLLERTGQMLDSVKPTPADSL